MEELSQRSRSSPRWSTEALTIVAQAKVLSGNKLEQLVVRLQRHSGRSKQECWRFVIQHGLKASVEHRRWTEEEIEFVREELVKRPIEEIAQKLKRSARAIRSMLARNHLGVREIRCDRFSIESLARALHVRREEIHFWIDQGWLQATASLQGNRRVYTITPEALMSLYKDHLPKLLNRGTRNQALFDAYFQYCYSPKHTVGEQLLDVRRDKRERAAFAALQAENDDRETEEDYSDRDFHIELGSGIEKADESEWNG